MLCPECHNKKSKVIESRKTDETIRRRRECITCGHRFTTHEVVFVDTEIKKPMVKIRRKSKSKSYEPVRSRKTDSFVVQHDDDTQEFIEGYLKGKL